MQSNFRVNKLQLVVLLALLFTAALCVLPASAQVNKGSISGTVVDPTGAAVSDVQVKATSVGTAQVFTVTSDGTGSFRLLQLPIGPYNLELTKSGFRKTVVTGVSVSGAVDTGIGGVKMEVGATAESVEVTAAPPLVESTEAQISDTFGTTYLNNIPGIQENQGLDNLAILLPGVVNNRDLGFSNTNGTGFSVDGLRGRNNDQQIDGQNNNDNSVAGPGIFLGDAEFVEQYQVITSNFGPEYGRNAGSVINIHTKQGSNSFHGSVYATESNSYLDSLSNIQKMPQSSPTCPSCFGQGLRKPPHFNDAFGGATIGGPVIKNKVFFFGGYDTEINASKFLYQTGLQTPTPAGITQMAGCYPGSASVAALQSYGPYSIKGGNPQPSGATTPQLLAGIDEFTGNPYPGFTPNNEDGTCHVDMAGVQRTLPNWTHQYDLIGRVDVTGSRDTVYGRYLWQKINTINQDSFVTGYAALGYPNDVPSTGQQMGIGWTHRFSDRMINELRLNFSRINVEFGKNEIGNTVPGQAQLPNALANVIFLAAGQGGFGPATNSPQGRIVNTYQVQDNWNYVVGKHQLKAGVNYTYQRSPNKFLPNLNGQYRFADWNQYAGDYPNRIRIALGAFALDFREHDSFFYVGDDWKVSNSLTLNLGLTYSYYGQPANLFHTLTTKQQTGPNPFWDPTLPLSVTTFPTIPAPKNSVGPSIGFAYSPQWGGFLTGNGKTVFRGGYRLSYDPPFYNIYLNISSAAPQVLLQSLTRGAADTNPLPAAPTGPNVRAALASQLTLGVFDPRRFNSTNVTPKFGPDRVHEWSFGLQRELGAHAAFEARYVGNRGLNLFQSINANPRIDWLANSYPALLPPGVTPCTNPPAGAPNVAGHVNCNLAANLRGRTNTGYSDYNGLQTEFRTTNLFKQLTMKTNYTFSKTTDNVSEIFSTFAGGGSNVYSQNPLDFTKGEHGISGLDFRHNWTLSFSESLPFYASQHGFAGHVLGGWVVGGTYIITSGQPYTPTQLFFNAFTGGCGGGGCGDASFNGAFIGTVDQVRPFYGNPGAPAASVGAYAGDVCLFAGAGCSLATNQLVDWAAFNSTGAVNQVTQSQVRYILNGATADSIFGTPFGNVGRNQVRDARTNTANFQVTKIFKVSERVNVQFHMSMINAFNHPNFGYNGVGSTTFGGIDPLVDADAGPAGCCGGSGTGFGHPEAFDGGHRIIRFGLKLAF